MIEKEKLEIGKSYYVLVDNAIPKWKYVPSKKKYAGMCFTEESGAMLNPIYFFTIGSGHHNKVPWSTDNLGIVFEDYQEAIACRKRLINEYIDLLNIENIPGD